MLARLQSDFGLWFDVVRLTSPFVVHIYVSLWEFSYGIYFTSGDTCTVFKIAVVLVTRSFRWSHALALIFDFVHGQICWQLRDSALFLLTNNNTQLLI